MLLFLGVLLSWSTSLSTRLRNSLSLQNRYLAIKRFMIGITNGHVPFLSNFQNPVLAMRSALGLPITPAELREVETALHCGGYNVPAAGFLFEMDRNFPVVPLGGPLPGGLIPDILQSTSDHFLL